MQRIFWPLGALNITQSYGVYVANMLAYSLDKMTPVDTTSVFLSSGH